MEKVEIPKWVTCEIEVNLDGQSHRKSFRRVCTIDHTEVLKIAARTSPASEHLDERFIELAEFISTARLPFQSADHFEYWLLDPKDDSPLALIFSCTEPEQMTTFPNKTEWTALPAAVMPIERTEIELENSEPPVNYRVERMVDYRAGFKPRAQWFNRTELSSDQFPTLMIQEDWPEEEQQLLCQRYLQRQSTRLLMLQNISSNVRADLELSARDYALEVHRYHPLYPAFANKEVMNSILVEARLRLASEEKQASIHNRRDGVHYL